MTYPPLPFVLKQVNDEAMYNYYIELLNSDHQWARIKFYDLWNGIYN